ncbi:MAG: hypothetical protein CME12_02930, partial [Gemmatimonadetes bacterium]|nr:hypothetical protein [Gemmatimonadota bacterium]
METCSNSSRSKAPFIPSWKAKSSTAVRSSPSWVAGWVWRRRSEAVTLYATIRIGHIWRTGSVYDAPTSSKPNRGSLRLRDTWPRS